VGSVRPWPGLSGVRAGVRACKRVCERVCERACEGSPHDPDRKVPWCGAGISIGRSCMGAPSHGSAMRIAVQGSPAVRVGTVRCSPCTETGSGRAARSEVPVIHRWMNGRTRRGSAPQLCRIIRRCCDRRSRPGESPRGPTFAISCEAVGGAMPGPLAIRPSDHPHENDRRGRMVVGWALPPWALPPWALPPWALPPWALLPWALPPWALPPRGPRWPLGVARVRRRRPGRP
jgi:hypothetical protein